MDNDLFHRHTTLHNTASHGITEENAQVTWTSGGPVFQINIHDTWCIFEKKWWIIFSYLLVKNDLVPIIIRNNKIL